jgi:hypothetical protein
MEFKPTLPTLFPILLAKHGGGLSGEAAAEFANRMQR